jgi:hypothetical protein
MTQTENLMLHGIGKRIPSITMEHLKITEEEHEPEIMTLVWSC